MKKLIMLGVLFFLSVFVFLPGLHSNAENYVNLNPDPSGELWIANLPELTQEQKDRIAQIPELTIKKSIKEFGPQLPTSVNNAETKYFRPIFSQRGGSCGQASGIGYTFTYEMALARDVDAGINSNQYPEHFTWNFLNNGSGHGSWYFDGWDIIKTNGIPNVVDYGGMSTPHPYRKWISGYDKYYNGLSNRTLEYFSVTLDSSQGFETLKQWFDNHGQGDATGGLVNFACNIHNSTWDTLSSDSSHSGDQVITAFGDSGYHAMTFVGYDDTVKYDYNGDGLYTNNVDINGDGVVDVKDWEIGAVILANSWGTSWGDNGFAWVPYSVLAHNRNEGGITNKKVYMLKVTPTTTVTAALKVSIKHSMRNKIQLQAGVASSESATTPEYTKLFKAFYFDGGPYPMNGEDDTPIEIALDVSDILAQIGDENAKKFFLIVKESDSSSEATGEVVSLSLMDYTDGVKEVQGQKNVAIANNTTTYVSVKRSGDTTDCFTDTNLNHVTNGRAYYTLGFFGWGYYAVGSFNFMGYFPLTTTSLTKVNDYYYTLGCN